MSEKRDRSYSADDKVSIVQNAVTAFEEGQFLTLTGVIDAEGALRVEPGFQVKYRRRDESRPEVPDEALRDALILEFLDGDDKTLTQAVIPLAPLCTVGSGRADDWVFALSIPFPTDYHGLRYYRRERLLKQLRKPPHPPEVRFERTPQETAGNKETIAWEVSGPRDADIRSIVLYSHDDRRTWQAIVAPSANRSNRTEVSFADLPGGQGRLKAIATDGFTTAEIESPPFHVALKGIRPSILSPVGGTEIVARRVVHLYGQAYDYERQDRALSQIVWRSSRDGELGHGAVIQVQLSPGVHTITLMCAGRETAVSVVVRPEGEMGRGPTQRRE